MKQETQQKNHESNFLINQLTFHHPKVSIILGLSNQPGEGYYKIHYKALPDVARTFFPACGSQNPTLYMQFGNSHPKVKVEITLADYPAVARKYYTWQLLQHFLNQRVYIKRNFVHNPEIWVPEERQGPINPFARYHLKVNVHEQNPTPALRIVFEGLSHILIKHLLELGQTHPKAIAHIKQVVFRHQIYPYKDLPEEAHANRNELYPILNPKLAAAIGIPYPSRRDSKKHTTYLTRIESFAQQFLQDEALLKRIALAKDWNLIPPGEAHSLKDTGKGFLFGNQQTGSDIRTGLIEHGPYRPVKHTQVKAFFIYHHQDQQLRNNLMHFLYDKTGKSGLSQFARVPIYFDPELDIVFQDRENPLKEISSALDQMSLEPDTGKLAFYLSPFDAQVSQAEKHRIYYLVKEALLQRNIAPQTIDCVRMQQAGTSFRYWVPNIAMAAIAKLGGIPWILNNGKSRDLVVGFGLYTTNKYNMRMVGSSVCFSHSGHFEEFDFFPENENYQVAAALEKALNKYIASHDAPDRLVIHYYKEMSNKAFVPIQKMMERFDPGIPVIVIRVNSTRTGFDIIRDLRTNHGMPPDGSYFHLGGNHYVLYINGYNPEKATPSHLPLPVQLSFKSSHPALLKDPAYVQGLMEQVYAFSKLYWRGILQPPMPVTVNYPKMLASQAVWFERQTLPGGALGVPWFL